MDLDDIIKKDNKIAEEEESIKKMQNNMIKEYEQLIELSNSLTNKVAINKSYRDEVQNYFIKNGFTKSSTNNEGRTVISDNITYYKCENSWIAICFNEYSDTEELIDIIIGNQGKQYRLSYKLDNNSDKMLVWKVSTKLNDEHVLASNYKDCILNCNSIIELSKLEEQIKENKANIKVNIANVEKAYYVYELQNKKQFSTFEEAFKAL